MSCAAHLLFDTFSCSSYTLIYDQLTVVVLHFLKLLNQVATRERINKPESETVLFFSLFVSLLLFFCYCSCCVNLSRTKKNASFSLQIGDTYSLPFSHRAPLENILIGNRKVSNNNKWIVTRSPSTRSLEHLEKFTIEIRHIHQFLRLTITIK